MGGKQTLSNETGADTVAPGAGVSPVSRLTDAQVFARDPEDYTIEDTRDTVERLRKIIERQRKARQDSEAVTELATKFKKTNAAAKKKKATLAADPMETKL
jgi:hypothetical protein